MTSAVILRSMDPADWPAVRRIYQEGIETGHATFESSAPDWASFDQSKLPAHRHVATADDNSILGWAAVSPVSSRPVYAGVVEHSIYVASEARGLGIGKALLQALIRSTESGGIWTIQANVFPENRSSLRLHAGAGFTVVGRRKRIARMPHGPLAGTWRDTVLIERRSASPAKLPE